MFQHFQDSLLTFILSAFEGHTDKVKINFMKFFVSFLTETEKRLRQEEHGSIPLYPSVVLFLHHITESTYGVMHLYHIKACAPTYIFPPWYFHV